MGPSDLATATEEAKAKEVDVKVPSHTLTSRVDSTRRIQAETVNMEDKY